MIANQSYWESAFIKVSGVVGELQCEFVFDLFKYVCVWLKIAFLIFIYSQKTNSQKHISQY